MTLALALLLTIGLELGVAWGLAPAARARLRIDVPLLNLLTWPLATVWLLHGDAPLLVVELAVVLVEAAGYRIVTGLSRPRALALAFVANLVTTAVGLAWQGLA